jgi:hypothetical protein
VRGVVLDAAAEPDLAQHLEVVRGPHPQALGLEELALVLEPLQALVELLLDRDEGVLHPVLARHVVRRREGGVGRRWSSFTISPVTGSNMLIFSIVSPHHSIR